MKEISKQLIHFMKTQFGSNINNNNNNNNNNNSNGISNDPMFSKKSRQFLRMIYGQILKGVYYWNTHSHQIQSTPLKQIIRDGEFQKSSSYSHIPLYIKSLIEKSVKYEKTYHFKINADTYTVVMVYPLTQLQLQTKPSMIDHFFEQSLYKIYLWLFVADRFASHQCSNKMNIYLYFTDHLKVLSKIKMEPLDTIHANTAFTTSCSPSTEIVLFRLEEWFKAYIHETFHNLGFDFSTMDNAEGNKRILELFPIQKDVRLFETYCETWAEIIHIMFVSFFSTQNKHNWSLILQKMEGLLRYEKMWSAFQCAKILNHYRLSYEQLTNINCPIAKKLRERQYKENTYILSYFVIKAMLIVQSNDFIEWCLCHNGTTLNFKKTPQNIVEYCGLVTKIYQTPKWLAYIEPMEKWFNDPINTGHDKIKSMEEQTLRMTAIE